MALYRVSEDPREGRTCYQDPLTNPAVMVEERSDDEFVCMLRFFVRLRQTQKSLVAVVTTATRVENASATVHNCPSTHRVYCHSLGNPSPRSRIVLRAGSEAAITVAPSTILRGARGQGSGQALRPPLLRAIGRRCPSQKSFTLGAPMTCPHPRVPPVAMTATFAKEFRVYLSSRKPESTEGRPWGQPLKKPAGAPLNLG